MGYKIKLEDTHNLSMLTAGLISEWTQTMSSVSKNISDFTTTYGFEGSSADALKTYFSEVHSTVLVPSIQIALQGLYDKVTLYAGNYYSIDADIHAQFNYDTFSEAISRVNIEKTNFENEADLFESALDSISDLFAPGKPDRTVLEQAFADLKTYVTNLQEDVGEHETAYTTEAETVSEMICDIKSIISEYMGKNPSEIYTYQSGNVTLAGNYSDLCSGVQDILTYHQENSARLSECEEYRAEVQTQLDIERAEDEAKAKIINSVVAIGGIAVGCVVTVASGGTLGPVVATFAVAAISYNGSELYEGVDSYLLASSGDPYTQATNPLRDTIFFGNDTAYNIFGFTANTGFALTNGLALGKVTKMTNGQVLANVLVDMGKDEIFGRAADFSLDVLGDVTGHEFSQTERALINGAVSIGGNARDLYGAYHPKTTDGTGVRVNDVDTNGIDTTFGNVRVNADDSINLRNGITSDTTDVDAHGSHHTADGDNNGMVRNHDGTADNRQGNSPAFGRNSSGDGTEGSHHTADGDSDSARVRDNDNDNVRDTNNNDYVRDTTNDGAHGTTDNNGHDITDNGVHDTAESSAHDVTDNGVHNTAESNAHDTTGNGASDTADNSVQDTADNNAQDVTDNDVHDTADNNTHDTTDNNASDTAESSAQDTTDNDVHDTADNNASDIAEGSAQDVTDNGASDTAESSAQDVTDNGASDTAESSVQDTTDNNAHDVTDSGESETADNNSQDATDSGASDTADSSAHDADDSGNEGGGEEQDSSDADDFIEEDNDSEDTEVQEGLNNPEGNNAENPDMRAKTSEEIQRQCYLAYNEIDENPDLSLSEKIDAKKKIYFSTCDEIGKNPDLSPSEKVAAMQEMYENLGDGNRRDVQCIASDKYLNADKPFRDNGSANPDYPIKQGFNMEEGKQPKAISRDNPMQDSVDRYGWSKGAFVSGMVNGESASFESRALAYIENPEAYHVYDVDNGRYCDAVDMVRNCDPNDMQPTIDNINKMIDTINDEQGLDLDHIDSEDMQYMIEHYELYQKNLANDIPEIPVEDAPYGLSGEAAPWDTKSGERLSDGGADQKWLPLSVNDFEKIGIFKER